MKILFYSYKDFEKPFLAAANVKKYQMTCTHQPLSLGTAWRARGIAVVSVFTGDDVSAIVLEELYKNGNRYIVTRAAGYDNIDIARAAELGIRVANAPAYSPNAIAEHALALMLALNRRLVLADAQVHRQNFTLDKLIGFDLHRKTIGIIGTGKIGSTLVRLLHGFDCRLIAHDMEEDRSIASAHNVEYMPLADLCRQADIISLHTCLTPATKHLINKRLIDLMKPGVMIINTSRGGCVNTADVIAGLESGQVGYFGADVYEKERGLFFFDHSHEQLDDDMLKKLMAMPNVLITPHQAFATKEALKNIADTTFSTISSWEEGKLCRNELTSAYHAEHPANPLSIQKPAASAAVRRAEKNGY